MLSFGNAAWNRDSLGMNQCVANADDTDITIGLGRGSHRCFSRTSVPSISPKLREMPEKGSAPSGVGTAPVGVLSKSGRPRWFSRRPMVRLTAGLVTPSSLAALAKVPQRITASNATRVFSDGRIRLSWDITECNPGGEHFCDCHDPAIAPNGWPR